MNEESGYVFGRFRIDDANRQLWRGDEAVHLEPKSFDALLFLVEHAGRLVTKQQLVDAVWSRAAVTDNSLTRCIHQVRAALEDDADAPAFVETVPGSGYRFIAPACRIEEAEGERRYRRSGNRYRMAILLVLILFAATMWLSWERPPPRVERLAVLPLVNLTGDADQDHFVQGVHDALIAELSRIAAIDVISRTSVMAFRGTTREVADIADRLNVDAVVEGSVLRTGDKITVTVQLIATQPERHLWAGRYHRDTSALFEIATEIVAAIVSEIALELEPAPASEATWRFAENRPAYEELLAGRLMFERRTPESYRAARRHFERAIELDPELAPALVGLAHIRASAAIFGMSAPGDIFPEVRRMARKALEIDPDLAEAHLLIAGVAFYLEQNWAQAEKRVMHALKLKPSFANAYRLLSEIYSVTGRHDEALAAVERGRELDPLPPTSQFKPAFILYLARDFEAANVRARSALDHYPTFWQGHWLVCISEIALQRIGNALGYCEAAATYSGGTPMAQATLGYVLALAGNEESARSIASRLETLRRERYVSAAGIACVLAALGEEDRAYDYLQAAFNERDQLLLHAENSALFDGLRDDPRFASLQKGAPRP